MATAKMYEGIGLMSGTSLDGLDIAHCRFIQDSVWNFELMNVVTIPYNEEWRSKLSEAHKLPGMELALLDNELGNWMGIKVMDFINRHKISPAFVSSHGHTVFHQPERKLTLQIGNASAMHAVVSLPVIHDFRSLDVALGGHGAPLVPIGDELLFSDYAACLNLGGIANISMREKRERIAFDISPANMPLNYLVNKLGQRFDENGRLAASGEVDRHLLQQLNELPYYSIKGSKSLGFEWVNQNVLSVIDQSSLSIEDLLATVIEHESDQIARVLPINGRVLVTGGGARNDFFIERIRHYANKEVQLVKPSEALIDFKEALVFAFLGVLRQRGEINSLKSVTGALRDSCTGSIIGNIN